MKKMKAKIFLTTASLLMLLGSIACASLFPFANASETTSSQKATAVLDNIVGLNTNAYKANLTSDRNTTTLTLPQEDVIFNLTASQSSLRARFSFINGNIHQIYLSDYVGSPSLNQPTTNTLDMAKGFMQRYQNYAGNAVYGFLSSMIDGVAVNANVTKTKGNALLQVSVNGNQAEEDLVWTYVDNNGIPALSKNVVLTYSNGFLQSFLDNWQLYKTAGVPKLSSQNATAAALKAAQNFSYTAYDVSGVNVTVSGFKVVSIGNVTLSYLNYYEQTPRQSIRGGDPFTLYPSWYVALGFDKVYPGNVTGLRVRVWADTGEVSSADPMIFNYQPSGSNDAPSSSGAAIQEKDNQLSTMAILLAITVAVAGGMTGVCLHISKTKLSGFKRYWKSSLSKLKIASLCLAILFTTVLIASPEVQASYLKSEIYVATYQYTWLDPQEFSYASNIASYVQWLYQTYAGIDSNNNYGGSTNYNNIISNIYNDEWYYMGVVVFHFGPGYTPNYIDTNGVSVPYTAINSATSSYNQHYFIWMWTCTLADNFNFAHAWTQQSNLRSDGYNYPDSTYHCFIGFTGESPTLSYQSFEGFTQLAYNFPINFYYYAVLYGYNVHNSLNQASEAVFNLPYVNSQEPFWQGYMAYFPGYPPDNRSQGYYWGQMKVYGDSDIIIHQ